MATIRGAVASDSEAVFVLTKAFSTSFEPEPEAFARSFEHLLSDDGALLLVADEDGSVCAYLLGFVHETLFANGPVAWVEELMVAENKRREGVGASLIREFEAWAGQRGARLVALATRRASEFYVARGYEESAAYFRKLLG